VQTQAATIPASVDPLAKPGRMLPLDVFRGGTMAAMVLVNNAGGPSYAPLEHAEWHGWTFTDLIFPSFLWIVGVATTLSFAKRIERGDSRHKLLMHVVKRAALIFLIGLFLSGFPRFALTTIRIPGVLQRIAVCYLIGAALYLYAGTKARLLWTAGLLAGYWALMKLVPVPGCATGSLEMDCNFAKWIDGMFLSGHMWRASRTWDPEGIVSTLPAIATALLGIFAGQLLAARRTKEEKAVWLFFAGNTILFAGLMLSTWMPVNKQLWTPPFTLLTAGISFIVFACCYWLVDVQGWRRFVKPFAVYGVNALAIYVLSGLLARTLSLIRFDRPGGEISLRVLIWRQFFEPFAAAENASLAFALAHVLLFLGVAWFMYRRNWILRV
jgi:predicted acyltransferase